MEDSGARTTDDPSHRRGNNVWPRREKRSLWSCTVENETLSGKISFGRHETKYLAEELTMIQGINSAAEGELVSEDNTSVNRQYTASDPPTNRVANKVDLLAGVVLGPEADTAK